METVTYTVTKTVNIADADGAAIREGSVLQHIIEPDRGVVIRISRVGDKPATFLDQVGDIGIRTSVGCTRFTNQYSQWRHIPQNQQTYEERYWSWLNRPYEHDADRCKNKAEDMAVDGIMALLPDDIVDWDYDSGPYSLEDALGYLVRHLSNAELSDGEKL